MSVITKIDPADEKTDRLLIKPLAKDVERFWKAVTYYRAESKPEHVFSMAINNALDADPDFVEFEKTARRQDPKRPYTKRARNGKSVSESSAQE